MQRQQDGLVLQRPATRKRGCSDPLPTHGRHPERNRRIRCVVLPGRCGRHHPAPAAAIGGGWFHPCRQQLLRYQPRWQRLLLRRRNPLGRLCRYLLGRCETPVGQLRRRNPAQLIRQGQLQRLFRHAEPPFSCRQRGTHHRRPSFRHPFPRFQGTTDANSRRGRTAANRRHGTVPERRPYRHHRQHSRRNLRIARIRFRILSRYGRRSRLFRAFRLVGSPCRSSRRKRY